MYVSDLKREFYDVILGKRVLILVNFDVDAICSCRILQYLLLCDTVSYSIIPVQNQSELVSAYKESCEQVTLCPATFTDSEYQVYARRQLQKPIISLSINFCISILDRSCDPHQLRGND